MVREPFFPFKNPPVLYCKLTVRSSAPIDVKLGLLDPRILPRVGFLFLFESEKIAPRTAIALSRIWIVPKRARSHLDLDSQH
jgi:hypothetical protein